MRDPALYSEAIRLHTGPGKLGYKKIAELIGRSPQTVGNWLRGWKTDQARKSTGIDEEIKREAAKYQAKAAALKRQENPTFRGKPLTEEKLQAFWEVYNLGHPTQGDQWDDLMPAIRRHVAKSLAYEGQHPTTSRDLFKKHLLLTFERLHL